MLETNLDKLYKLLETVYEDLDKTKDLISKLQLEARKEALKDVPGVEGMFDGKYVITDANEKIEVPANYAAKSRIVYGDRLKIYEEDGKKMFKQVEKVSRKKVDAVVSKKEGKFYALTQYGDHELSPIAVEFNFIKVGDKIQVILPESNLKTPFATLDKSLEPVVPVVGTTLAAKKETPKEVIKPIEKSVIKVEAPVAKIETPAVKVEAPKEFVMDLTNKGSTPVVLNIEPQAAPTPQVATPPAYVTPVAPVVQPVKEVKPLAPFALEDDDLR